MKKINLCLLFAFPLFGLLSCEKDDERLSNYEFNIFDIVPDLSNNRFYIIENIPSKISIIDYETLTVVKSITSDATIGYCSIGNNGNKKELYVPRNDGWVFVYNAETLEKIDQIDIKRPSLCVVNNNGKLFISTDVWPGSIKVFDRATKTMITQTGDHEDTRLRMIPNTNTEIMEITTNVSPTDIDYFSFNSNGSLVLHKNDKYHGDYPLNAEFFNFSRIAKSI